MPGTQSWVIRVVCQIQVQKCMDLAYSVRLDSELLESWLFTTFTGWKNSSFSTMAILLSLGRGWEISPGTPVVLNMLLTELLRTQIFLGEMRRKHPGWTTAYRQECGLFHIVVSAPQSGLHAEERPSKVLPKTPGWGNQRGSPWTPFCEPHRSHCWCHYPSGWRGSLMGVDLGSQHAFWSSAQWLNEGIAAGVEQMYG